MSQVTEQFTFDGGDEVKKLFEVSKNLFLELKSTFSRYENFGYKFLKIKIFFFLPTESRNKNAIFHLIKYKILKFHKININYDK